MPKVKKNNTIEEPIENQLWKAADKLRKNIDAAEYKHIVLGLIFLKYISDAFEELFDKLKKGGQFYTLRSVVELLVEMLEPYKGRVIDSCCGSGGWRTWSDFDFNERFSKLKTEFEEQLKEEARLNVLIAKNLKKVKLV